MKEAEYVSALRVHHALRLSSIVLPEALGAGDRGVRDQHSLQLQCVSHEPHWQAGERLDRCLVVQARTH